MRWEGKKIAGKEMGGRCMSNYNFENHNKKVSHSYTTQDLLLQVIRGKLRKMKNSSDGEKNSTELSGENITFVTFVTVSNLPPFDKIF